MVSEQTAALPLLTLHQLGGKNVHGPPCVVVVFPRVNVWKWTIVLVVNVVKLIIDE